MKTVIEKLNEALTELEKETVSPIKTQTEQGIKNLIARAEGKIVGGKSHLPPILGVAMNVQKKTAATIAPGTEQAEKDAAEVEQLQKDVQANLTLEQKAFQAQIEKYVAAYGNMNAKQFQAALKQHSITIEAFADTLLIDVSSFTVPQKHAVCLERLKVLATK
jgi:hypothetical protein